MTGSGPAEEAPAVATLTVGIASTLTGSGPIRWVLVSGTPLGTGGDVAVTSHVRKPFLVSPTAGGRQTDPMDHSRLSMPIGEAIFTQRAIRRFRPDPVGLADVHLILEAAVRAPNGGNQQVARFLVVTNRELLRDFGALYHEAWWAKRRDEGFERREDLPPRYVAAAGLADAMSEVPCVVLALALHHGAANSVIPAVQNLMLAARSIGIGSVPTTLHPSVMARLHALFGIPDDVGFHLCVPLGYPAGNFGPNDRLPTSATTFLDRWGGPVPWE